MDSNGILKYGDGYVCDDSFEVLYFGDNLADFICRELGYTSFESYSTGMEISSGFISMDGLYCPKNAASLSSCKYTFKHNCHLDEGIKLQCSSSGKINVLYLLF